MSTDSYRLLGCRGHLPFLEEQASAAKVAASECAEVLERAIATEEAQQQCTHALEQELIKLSTTHKMACRSHSKVCS
jgi:hypothetical protein